MKLSKWYYKTKLSWSELGAVSDFENMLENVIEQKGDIVCTCNSMMEVLIIRMIDEIGLTKTKELLENSYHKAIEFYFINDGRDEQD